MSQDAKSSPSDEPDTGHHPATPSPGSARLWLFRLLAVVLPLLVLLLVEGVLRLARVGYETGFLVRPPDQVAAGGSVAGDTPPTRPAAWVSNRRFGWRFFPPQLARAPVPLALGEGKEGDVLRLVVLGGSAAQGVPEPAFGLASQLEAMLELRHPERRFEVINAAMTAISSHVVLPIARDLARQQPDVMVVYMGNNEVVGPFGAGSVFGRFSPRLSWIRATITLRSSRLGQLLSGWLSGLAGGATPAGGRDGRWRGMEMFLEQRLAADDPRLDAVAHHLEHNLHDIVTVGRAAGAALVVSTVASNLRDLPPFAEPVPLVEVTALVEEVLAVEGSALGAEALAQLTARCRSLVERYPTSPGAHFALGRVLLAAGEPSPLAGDSLARARDLDALRFRADGRINQVIRRVAEGEGVPWVDAETLFRRGGAAIEPLAGRRYFYEHVHFTFEGNYALAGALLPAVEAAAGLGETSGVAGESPPTIAAVAERLAFGPIERVVMDRAMLTLIEGPPFVAQPGHAADLEGRRQRLAELESALLADPAAWPTERRLAEARLERHPDDLGFRRRFAERLEQQGETARAVEQWRWLCRRLPGVLAWHDALAAGLAGMGQLDEALAELARAEELAPEAAGEVAINRGQILAAAGRLDDARAEDQRAIALRPFDPVPRYNLIALYHGAGSPSPAELERVVVDYRALVRDFPDFAEGHHNLGVALARLGRLDEAVASLGRAVAAAPSMASAHNSLGQALEALGRRQAAEVAYRQALAVAPRYALARFNLADLLLADERPAEAVEQYRLALALEPGNTAARHNLALALGLVDSGQR